MHIIFSDKNALNEIIRWFILLSEITRNLHGIDNSLFPFLQQYGIYPFEIVTPAEILWKFSMLTPNENTP